MDPKDNLELARHLLKPPSGQPKEACFRGACGRAYYAAFGVARDALEQIPLRVSSGPQAHGDVIRYLGTSTDVNVQAAGTSLDNLRVMRNTADYAVGRRAPAGGYAPLAAQTAVAWGHTIVTAIDAAIAANRRLSIP